MKEVELIPPEEMLGESDWDDQDLLTIEDAMGRVRHELEACRAALAHGDLTEEASGVTQARIRVLEAHVAVLDLGATPLARING
jgi:hypothetical protein